MGTQKRVRRATPETTDQAAPFSSSAEDGAAKGNGTWRKFAEPRGWAVKWDGFGLPGVRDRQVGNAQVPTAEAD